jgi:hypothetical protein
MNVHTDGNFICEECSCPFVHRITYLSHLRKVHSNPSSINIIKDPGVPKPIKVVEVELPDPVIQTLRGRTRWSYIRKSKQESYFSRMDPVLPGPI